MKLKKNTNYPNKIPKQWLHWARVNGIRPESPRNEWAPFYLIGRDRHWRVFGEHGPTNFEVSCDLEHFDRWANSGGGAVEIPKTLAEFTKVVNELIEGSKNVKPWFYDDKDESILPQIFGLNSDLPEGDHDPYNDNK